MFFIKSRYIKILTIIRYIFIVIFWLIIIKIIFVGIFRLTIVSWYITLLTIILNIFFSIFWLTSIRITFTVIFRLTIVRIIFICIFWWYIVLSSNSLKWISCSFVELSPNFSVIFCLLLVTNFSRAPFFFLFFLF